jgi:hypothetical protein
LKELQLEERPPQDVVDLVPHPFLDPLDRVLVLETAPVASLDRGIGMESVSKLGDERKVGKPQQGDGVAPVVEVSAVEITHGRDAPLELVLDAEIPEQVEQRLVGGADEVVEALDVESVEIEVGAHAARAIVRLEEGHAMTALEQVVATSQTRRTGAENRDVRHDDSAT